MVTDQQAAAGFNCERASLKLLLQFISFFKEEVDVVKKHNCGPRQIEEEQTGVVHKYENFIFL